MEQRAVQIPICFPGYPGRCLGVLTEATPGQHGKRHVQCDCAARKGAVLERLLSLSGMDLLVLSGALDYADESGESHLEPGIWGYLSANTCMQRLEAVERRSCW